MKSFFQLLDDQYDEMVSIRRHLHSYPELSFQETATAKYIYEYYRSFGIEVTPFVGGNGVVAKIYGKLPGKTIALRADFDALPIEDEKDVPYKSRHKGVMHACGHDGHTATLLVLAKCLHAVRENLSGTYVMIHQHAEEIAPGGALSMIEDGCLDGVDVIFGTHLWTTEPLGTVATRPGPIMAAADRFELTIQGTGGHGAQPHRTKDAIATTAQLVGHLQQIVSRRLNPLDAAVISIGSFVADNAFNIIADKARLSGTVRTFDPKVQYFIKEEMEKIIRGTCMSADCTYTFSYEFGFPAVINDPQTTSYLQEIAKQTEGVTTVTEIERQMPGEDFAYYLQHVDGCFFFTGAMPENEIDVYPHHHPKFDFNERAMLIAAKTLGNAAIQYNKR